MNKNKIIYKNWGDCGNIGKKKGFTENLSFNNGSSKSDVTIITDDLIPINEKSEPRGSRESGAWWRRFSRREILVFLLFSGTNFFAGVTFSLMAPFYPAEAEAKGATASEYGMVFGIFELVAFVASPLIGKYLHVLGPRKTFIAGILITGVATTFFGILDKTEKGTFLSLSFIIRIIAAFGDAAFVTANFSLVAVEFPRYIATTFATLETFFGLGLIVGPTLGGIFYELGGFMLPFLVVGVSFSLLGLVACVTMTAEKEEENMNEKAPSIFAVLRVPSVSLAGLSILAGAISMGFLSATLEPHVRQFGLSPVQTGFVFIIYGGIYAVTAPAWGWLCDKLLGSFVITLFGEAAIFLGFLIIGPVGFFPIETSLWITCVGLAIYGVGMGATMVASFILALEEAVGHGFSDNVQTYGVISALWNSFFALGSFIGPSLGGVLIDLGGFRWASAFVLGTQLIVLVLFAGYMLITGKCGVNDRYFKNLSDTTPLLGPEDPCCSKMLFKGSFDSSTDFSGKHYGTNNGFTETFSSSSS